ncbi:MAG: ABC transporter ATP-binding protein, partial [Christensenellales bacterium]
MRKDAIKKDNKVNINQNNKNKSKDTWGKLIKYIKKWMPAFIFANIISFMGVVAGLIAPNELNRLTEEIQKALTGTMDLNFVITLGIILATLYLLQEIFYFVCDYIMAVLTQRISRKMRNDISHKINKLPLKYFDSHSIGDTLSRVTNDVDTIGQSLNQQIAVFISNVAMVVGSVIAMLLTNWILALVAVGSSLIGLIVMAVIVKHSQKYFVAQQQILGALNGHIEESYAGHNVIKAYNAEGVMNKKFDENNDKLYKCAWKSQFLSGLMMPLMNFVGNFGYLAVCVVGAVLAMNGTIGFGVIVAFIVYVRLFAQPLSQIAQNLAGLQQASAASYRVFEFLDEEEIEDESSKTKSIEAVNGNIDFENVKFGYNKDKTIINDFSINIKSGQKVAVVGPTGAGKTTIVNLLMRFYETDGGNILIDGVPIKEMKRENVHNLFGMVLQDTWLFEGTIMENIKFSNKNATDEEVISACKAVGVHHFIKTLENGYNTVLSEEANISVGQKQLLTIARAFLQNAPMLILDEATSSVDTRTEQLIQNAMDKLMQGKTSIVIAHRLSTIKNADLILVMKDGDII